MLSYDYNHFEVSLGVPDDATTKEVNEKRKECQRLCDEAIRQYRVAKSKASLKCQVMGEKAKLEEEVERIRREPENEWTATDKAKVKALEDHEYWKRHDYDYDDDPGDY
jgi:erythromycin esterase-like protein